MNSSSLLGSQAQDAADSLQVLGTNKQPTWIVVDHYGLDARRENLILEGQPNKAATKLLVIDDLADRPHISDILLDQILGRKQTSLQDLVPNNRPAMAPTTRYWSGIRYPSSSSPHRVAPCVGVFRR